MTTSDVSAHLTFRASNSGPEMPPCESSNDTSRIARCRNMNLNGLKGTIPSEWTSSNAFPVLTDLDLRYNGLEGVRWRFTPNAPHQKLYLSQGNPVYQQVSLSSWAVDP